MKARKQKIKEGRKGDRRKEDEVKNEKGKKEK
jgi:hypothetical protein